MFDVCICNATYNVLMMTVFCPSRCQTCSSALCLFHEKDHKLSVDTSSHEVLRYTELARLNIPMKPKVPRVSCPDVIAQDATHYCQDCMHLTSIDGLLGHHEGHVARACADLVTPMTAVVVDAARRAANHCFEVKSKLDEIKAALHKLDQTEDQAERDIEATFAAMQKSLDDRELELKEKLTGPLWLLSLVHMHDACRPVAIKELTRYLDMNSLDTLFLANIMQRLWRRSG
jgi:hypothetical protein